MKRGLGPSGLFRLAMFAGLALSLLLSGCAGASSQAAASASTEEKHWGQCDRSRIVNVSFLCYQK